MKAIPEREIKVQSLFKNIDCKCEEPKQKQAIPGRVVLRVIKNNNFPEFRG